MWLAVFLLFMQLSQSTDAASVTPSTEGPIVNFVGEVITALNTRLGESDAANERRFERLRERIDELANSQPADQAAVFPRLNTLLTEVRATREDAARTGPIRDAIDRLTKLIYALLCLVVAVAVLAVIAFAANAYRKFVT